MSTRTASPQWKDGSLTRPPGRVARATAWLFTDFPRRFLTAFHDRNRARTLVSVLLGVFAMLGLLAIAAEHVLLQVDTAMQGAALDARSGWLNDSMVALTFLGTRWVTGALTLGIVLWALVTGRCRTTALILVAAFALNPLLEIGFKELVGRPRPELAQLLPGNGPSFPSGHVLAAVGFYGLLPLLVWEATASYVKRRLVFFGSLLTIAVVTASRVYLDVHWTTDVIAGVLLGTVVVAVSYDALRGHGLAAARRCCAVAAA